MNIKLDNRSVSIPGSDGVRDDRRIGDDMVLEQDDGPLLGAFKIIQGFRRSLLSRIFLNGQGCRRSLLNVIPHSEYNAVVIYIW